MKVLLVLAVAVAGISVPQVDWKTGLSQNVISKLEKLSPERRADVLKRMEEKHNKLSSSFKLATVMAGLPEEEKKVFSELNEKIDKNSNDASGAEMLQALQTAKEELAEEANKAKVQKAEAQEMMKKASKQAKDVLLIEGKKTVELKKVLTQEQHKLKQELQQSHAAAAKALDDRALKLSVQETISNKQLAIAAREQQVADAEQAVEAKHQVLEATSSSQAAKAQDLLKYTEKIAKQQEELLSKRDHVQTLIQADKAKLAELEAKRVKAAASTELQRQKLKKTSEEVEEKKKALAEQVKQTVLILDEDPVLKEQALRVSKAELAIAQAKEARDARLSAKVEELKQEKPSMNLLQKSSAQVASHAQIAQAAQAKAMSATRTYMKEKQLLEKRKQQFESAARVWDDLGKNIRTDMETNKQVGAYSSLAASVEDAKLLQDMILGESQREAVEAQKVHENLSLHPDDESYQAAAKASAVKAKWAVEAINMYRETSFNVEKERIKAQAGLTQEEIANENARARQSGAGRYVQIAEQKAKMSETTEREVLAKAVAEKRAADIAQKELDKDSYQKTQAVTQESTKDMIKREAGAQRKCEVFPGHQLLHVSKQKRVQSALVSWSDCMEQCQTSSDCQKMHYDWNSRKCMKFLEQHGEVATAPMPTMSSLVCEDWNDAVKRVSASFSQAQSKVQEAASFVETFSEPEEGLHRFKLSLLQTSEESSAVQKWHAIQAAEQAKRDEQNRIFTEESATKEAAASSLVQENLDEFLDATVADTMKRQCRKFPNTRLASVGQQLKTPGGVKTSQDCFKTCFDQATCEQAMFHGVSRTCQLRTSSTMKTHEGSYFASDFSSVHCRFA